MRLSLRFLTATLLLVLTLFALSEYLVYQESLKRFKQGAYESASAKLALLMRIKEEHLKLLAMMLASDETVLEAYRRDEPELIGRHFVSFWQKARADKLLYEIHFFRPPAINFFNFSDDDTVPRDLSTVRSDMVWVSSSFRPSEHVMVCRSYAGIRATYPILDGKRLVGGLSLGAKLDWIPLYLGRLLETPVFLAYRIDALRFLSPGAYRRYLREGIAGRDWLLATRTREVPDDLLRLVDFDIQRERIAIGGKDYYLTLHAVRGFRGEVVAKVGVLHPMEGFFADFNAMVLRHFAVLAGVLILFVGLVLIFSVSIQRRIQKIRTITRKLGAKRYDVLEAYRQVEGGDEIAQIHRDLLALGETLKRYDEQMRKLLAEREVALQEATRRLEYQMLLDSELQIPNRTALQRRLRERGKKRSSLALLDIFRFTLINDSYGVEVGNRILKRVAQILQAEAESADPVLEVYRSGSDEFVLLQAGSEASKDFIDRIRRVIRTIEDQSFVFEEIEIDLNIELHAGVAIGRNFLLERADLAAREAQRRRLDVVVYDEEKSGHTQEHKRNIEMLKRIKLAIQTDRVVPYFQPIVDGSGRVRKYEALLRIVEPEGSVLAPGAFLEIVKSSKFYGALTRIMVQKSLACFANRREAVSINLSIIDLLDEETIAAILSALERFDDPSRVVFELLESESMEGYDEVERFVEAVRKKGAKIAIDDFGTGYSNFSYLATIRPDYLKIDGSLIVRLLEGGDATMIVRSIVEFAHAMGAATVAEFIADASHFEAAKRLGVDEFQGFYFGRPEPMEDEGADG